MEQIGIVNTNPAIRKKIKALCAPFTEEFSLVFLDSREKCLEFLNYELPELSIYNFCDPALDCFSLLEEVKADPWLHFGGIVGIYEPSDEQRIQAAVRGTNMAALIPRHELEQNFIRLLGIINRNRHILFQRDLQLKLLTAISGSFVIDNDPFDLNTYSHLITNYLFNLDFITQDDKERLHVALIELLMNAVEHGNCRISYAEKSAWLESGRSIFDLIREKNREPQIQARQVRVNYRILPEKSVFHISDDGAGFDWRVFCRPAAGPEPAGAEPAAVDELKLHGRGISMAAHYARGLSYNEKGNAVTIEYPHRENASNLLPGAFSQEEELAFNDGDIVFSEEEESNFLYYIVAGKLDIYSSGKLISTLTPADIFLGEMSFLLNNRRTATVKSRGRSVLLRIPKKEFLLIIKREPHYGIFLARLLAQRLHRLNQFSVTVV